ncbi:unnamed protein product [Dovyalis caffra]|uniref:Uncharacterized protein n=1 Tax=Dovyalis caffra TaxID=77055 RepID=A0AAV1SM62_9ROSI|nr:unnamed protein product [Dovyalis caffra]
MLSVSQLMMLLKRLVLGFVLISCLEDEWWEGMVFDHKKDANERFVFFPDEGDERVITITGMRITRDGNEVLGLSWDRGVWVLMHLAKELKQDVPLPKLVKKVYSSQQDIAKKGINSQILLYIFENQFTDGRN